MAKLNRLHEIECTHYSESPSSSSRQALRVWLRSWIAACVLGLCAPALAANWEINETSVFTEFNLAPPAADTEAARRDLEELLQLQGQRASVRKDGSSEVRPSGDCKDANKQRFPGVAGMFGPKSGVDGAQVLTTSELDLVRPLGGRLISEIERVAKIVKAKHGRVRPYNARPDLIKACSVLPEKQIEQNRKVGHSFPSSHAAIGQALGEVLAEIFPGRADVIRAQGKRVGFLRKRVGVHFPSDVAAGSALGDAIVKNLNRSKAFRQEVDALTKAARAL